MNKRYTEAQIIKAIKLHEAGTKVEDLCSEMGIMTGLPAKTTVVGHCR